MRLSTYGPVIGPLLRLALAGVMLAQMPGAAQAETPAAFYSGKTLNLTLGAAPGGLADTVGRIFAPVFQSHIPGNPTVIVLNKPGAGGMVAASQLQSDPDDGTAVSMLLGNNLTTPLVRDQKGQFDPDKVQWIGSLRTGDYPYAMYVFDSAPVQSAQDLLQGKMALQVGATSFTNENRIYPSMINDFLGTRMHIVSGYQGSGEVYLALERGEVDGWFEAAQRALDDTSKLGQYAAEGKIKPILMIGEARDPHWPDVPAITEALQTPAQKAVAHFLFISARSGRPIAVPGAVPADRVAALRTAFEQTITDPAFAAELKAKLNVTAFDGLSGADLDQILTEINGTPDDVLAQVRALVLGE